VPDKPIETIEDIYEFIEAMKKRISKYQRLLVLPDNIITEIDQTTITENSYLCLKSVD
jgi:hypothetical protein